MPILFRDFETRSTLNLASVGAWRYAADLTTEVLCVAYAVEDGTVQIWVPGQPIPEEFTAAARDPDWLIVAHNDGFEAAIETRLLGPRYGWPLTPIGRHRCTMATASANALPGALDAVAAALGLSHRKDAEGHRLMMQMAKPRRARRGEDPNTIHWHDDLERRLRLQEYCRRDVEIERELHERLPPLSPDEQKLWELDATINARGFFVDLKLAEAAQEIARQEQTAIDEEIAEITDGKITSINQIGKLQALLQDRGHNVTSLTKRSVSALLARQPAPDVQRLLELRAEGAQAAARKLASLLAGIDDDHRLRGTLRFHGASTGRWSGARFQPQNLKKPQTKDLNAAINAVRVGDLQRVRELGAPLAVIGDISRNMICAAPGRVLFGADFSAIESRVLAWLAGEQWKIETYRQFDATGNPALEPYCVTATRILKRAVTPEDEAGRTIGKTCDLAFGFGGGLGAWRRFDRSSTYSDSDVENFKAEWRATHAATVRFWHGLENALRRALRGQRRIEIGNLAAESNADNLYLTLPGGRHLAYPDARLEPGRFADTTQIVFKDNGRGGWTDVRGWHGTFVENVVQAVARDLLAAAMQRLEAAGYPVTLHCHDEVVCEVPEDFGSLEAFLGLMITAPDWAAGLPLAAKAWRRVNYAKSQPAAPWPSAPPPATPVKAEATTMKTVKLGFIVPSQQHHGLPLNAGRGEDGERQGGEYARIRLGDVIGQPLSNGKVKCPFHADGTPSLHVYTDHFHCFGCGARGDHVDWLMMVEGMTRDAALRLLATWDRPPVHVRRTGDETASRTLAAASRLWEAAKPIAGTPTICYLADVRGIDTDMLPTDDAALRFHPRCPFGPGTSAPCLIALYRDVETDAPAGIHRIALTPEVFAGGDVTRLTLGTWPTPRAIKLWPVADQLFLGEGIETVLAAATRLQHRGGPMRPAWAAGSSGNISKFPVLADVKQLTLLVDHDASGQQRADTCRLRWRAAGREVVQLRPKRAGADFNDLVLERRPVAP